MLWKAKKATLFFELFLAKTSTVQSVVEENCDTSSNVGAQQNGLKAFGTQKEGRHGLARLLARRPENTAARRRRTLLTSGKRLPLSIAAPPPSLPLPPSPPLPSLRTSQLYSTSVLSSLRHPLTVD